MVTVCSEVQGGRWLLSVTMAIRVTGPRQGGCRCRTWCRYLACSWETPDPSLSSAAGSVHSPSTSMATSSQYRQLLSDYGPPSLGYTQGTGNSQVPQSKYAELLAIIEELGKEIRPTYAGSKSAMERLKRGIIHARGLVRECLAETERNARS
ncbi:cyclin-dependent kinase 2-associated protein 1 isoform X1 [Octodon degus]|uniref:Cyclin-dependent kinase 2-associated protein 1 isoform X1 n=2 Tax=Hystricomorpha TaxID=33550 RepID=A0A6P3F0B7_OCTDE|nr:cyclin-dependent kinase 2-associated protein 1 isoform X1 [Octodon degus]